MIDEYRGVDVKILQVLPAQGWGAVIASKPDSPVQEPFFVMPIIGWAFIEYDDTGRDVVPMSMSDCGEACFPGDNENFMGLLKPGERAEKYEKEACERISGKGA